MNQKKSKNFSDRNEGKKIWHQACPCRNTHWHKRVPLEKEQSQQLTLAQCFEIGAFG